MAGVRRFDFPAVGVYFFRPTSWVLFAALIKLGGGYASAPVFHAVVLLLHGIAAWLLYRVLRSFLDARAAFAGGALFGLMPGGIQAVTWMAAAGDQLAVLFLLLAVLCSQAFARGGSRWQIPAIALCALLAFLAKETMIALLPAAALGLWSVPLAERRDRRWWIPLAAAALGVAVGALARWFVIGILGPAYAYEVRLEAGELARMHEPLLQMIVPWDQSPEFAGMEPWAGTFLARLVDPVAAERAVAVTALAVALVLGVASRVRVLPRALLVLAAFVLAFLPTVAAWHFGFAPTNTLSRAMYGPLAVFCAFVAICVEPALLPGRRAARRFVPAVVAGALLLLALIEIDVGVHVARTNLAVSDRIRERLDSLEEIARAEGPEVHLIAVDSRPGYGAQPLLYNGVANALSRPFSRLERSVTFWADLRTLDRCRVLRKETRPIRVAAVRDSRFEPVGERLPPIPAELPGLRPVAGRPGSFVFASPVAMRAVVAFRFRARPASDGARAPRCVWTSGAGEVTGPVVVPPGSSEVTCLATRPAPSEGLGPATLTGIRIEGVEVVDVPAIVRELPEIAVSVSVEQHTIVLGRLPEITFVPPFDSPYYRITFDFLIDALRFPLVYSVSKDRLERVGERELRFVPRPDDAVEWPGHPYRVTWHDLPRAFRSELSARGLHAVAIQFRIQGINADKVTPESESAWDTLTLLEE